MRCSIFFLLCLALQALAIPLQPREDQCGYDACTIPINPDVLNVHLVAHSHDDVGWLKTVDQYYYGSRSNIQLAGVQYIIDSVIRALWANRDRKFIQVESAFFYTWWNKQTPEKRDQVIELINRGQLEFVGGAWSMNDEAAAHYHSIIDQFTYGLKFLQKTLPECARPKIGWQIDPFGHTREMASLFAQMGYDALFFSRLDWRDKGARLNSKTAEMLWRGSANLGDKSQLFTHVLYNHYSPPPGFYFDVLSEDDPLIPDQESAEYNLVEKMKFFNEFVNNQTEKYETNHIILTMGNDFTYQDAHYSYKNLDILIQAYKDTVQEDKFGRKINLLYSTPACYLKAVNDVAKVRDLSFKVKTDDFIPYASDYHTYWSGYYTSRPTQKRFERQGNNFLQVAKQLTTFSGPDFFELDKNLDDLRAAMGIMQHHDAITGTEKQHVADDYARIVMQAFDKTHQHVNNVISKLLAKPDQTVNLEFESCLLANVSICEPSQAKQFVVAIHNPLSRKVSYHVRLPVNSNEFTVTDHKDAKVPHQLTPSIDEFKHLPSGSKTSKFDLVFLAEDLPPLGVRLYYVTNNAFEKPPKEIDPVEGDERFTLGTENNGVSINSYNGRMVSVAINEVKVTVDQTMMYYIGAQGNNTEFKFRASGAYIFRPDPENPTAIKFTDVVSDFKVYKGDIVDEIHQTFNEWCKQIIRVYKNNENHVELDWLVGPIDTSDEQSKEVISRFTGGLMTGDELHTDSNGREMLTRRNNYRATFEYSNEEPIAGNYYPITSSISVVDNKRGVEMIVLNDRAQGGASLNTGELELMVHRRTLKDDAFGVGEALMEDEFGKGLVVRGQHYLTVGSSKPDNEKYSRKNMRDIAQRKLLAPWVLVADATSVSLEDLKKKLNFEFVGLNSDLDKQVQILTLEPWTDGKVLLRFEHIFELAEGGTAVTIETENLFKLFKVTDLEQMTLGANQKFDDNERLEWKAGACLGELTDCDSNEIPDKPQTGKATTVVIQPMEILTYIATVAFS